MKRHSYKNLTYSWQKFMQQWYEETNTPIPNREDWKGVIVKYLLKTGRQTLCLYDGKLAHRLPIHIMPGNFQPDFQFSHNIAERPTVIIVGADWLKENLTEKQFAEYVVDRINGKAQGR